MWLCHKCGEQNDIQQSGDVCWNCGTGRLRLTEQENISDREEIVPVSEHTRPDIDPENAILSDFIRFSVTAFNKNRQDSYQEIGEHGTLKRILALVITIDLCMVLGLKILIGSNPYIALSRYLYYSSFIIAIIFLGITSYFSQIILQFFSFRLLGGKGNIIAHGYLTVLTSIYYLLVLILATFTGGVSEALGNILLITGCIFLLVLWLIALQNLHHMSFIRTVGAMIVGTLMSTPLIFAAFYLFGFFQAAYPYEIYDWRTSATFDVMLIFYVGSLGYMMRAETKIQNDVHPKGELKQHTKRQNLSIALIVALAIIALPVFLHLDAKYTTIQTELPPYQITFLPEHNNVLFIATHAEEFRGPTLVEEWNLSQTTQTNAFQFDFLAARMRPSLDGNALVLSDRQSPHGDATIFNPITNERTTSVFPYLEDYGILNPKRNEFYITTSSRGIGIAPYGAYISSSPTRINIKRDRNDELIFVSLSQKSRAYSITIHPTAELLFITGDNYIDIMDLDSLQIIKTIRIGGKLRDLAISPDGHTIYITDALWQRVLTIPLSKLGLEETVANFIREENSETEFESFVPAECNPNSIACMHTFSIAITEPDTLIISFSLQPLQNTTIAENVFFSADLYIGTTDKPEFTAPSHILGPHEFTFSFKCTSNPDNHTQQCTSTPVKFSNSPDELTQGEKICFSFSSLNMNNKSWHCLEQPQNN